MIKLLQKDYISFIFNLFSSQLYTHLEQYNSMLKNSNKQIMTIKILTSLSSLLIQSNFSINLALQTSSLPLSLALTMDWTLSINLVFLPWPTSIPSKKFEDFCFHIQSKKKIRVWNFLNWGTILPLIIRRNSGDFGV